jgi:serine/threonine-protein kinase
MLTTSLLQNLNALYRSERWFDFEKILNPIVPTLLDELGIVGVHIRELSIKVLMKIRKLDQASKLLQKAKGLGDNSFELDMCEASIDAMEAQYEKARSKLELMNRNNPMNSLVLNRLVLVCEQSRDYEAAAGYLRVAMKVCRSDEKLMRKRQQYETLGVW